MGLLNLARHACRITLYRRYHVANIEWGHRATTSQQRQQQQQQSLSSNSQLIEKFFEFQHSEPILWSLINAYRIHGFRQENWNPIPLHIRRPSTTTTTSNEPLEIQTAKTLYQSKTVNHNRNDENINFLFPCLSSTNNSQSMETLLQSIYTKNIGVEFEMVQDFHERQWLYSQYETMELNALLTNQKPEEIYRQILLMQKSYLFDKFLSQKFQSVKRYSGEGAESALVCFDTLLQSAACDYGISHVVMGTAHRGRNNLLTVLLNYPIVEFFTKMKGLSEFPANLRASGDTFSHFSTSTNLNYSTSSSTTSLRVSLLPNPSHLEAVVPVAVGKCRSKMQTLAEGDYDNNDSRNGDSTLCIQVHGDAAVVGQGIVSETLALSQSPHFSIGGSIHVVINNQLGFTTEPTYGRSWRNCTDLAYPIGAPVLHVNAEDSYSVARAAKFALNYRERYRRDIFINLVCYRHWGHNELDEPSLTQPILYSFIRNQLASPSLPERLLQQQEEHLTNEIQRQQLMKDLTNWTNELNGALKNIDAYSPTLKTFKEQWSSMSPPSASGNDGLHVYNTGVDANCLRHIALQSVQLPTTFQPHATLQRTFISRRQEKFGLKENNYDDVQDIDWATAEALAIGSLLLDGQSVRISGQDVGRGTFSQRHMMLVDQTTDQLFIPLNHLSMPPTTTTTTSAETKQVGKLELANSILSEFAVLGFELGMAMDNPNRLNIWEAQFGDFFNGAQIILDTFIGSSETKWLYQNGLVLLLPHGYEGTGPEHSSCRLERFLQMTDSNEAPIKSLDFESVDDDRVNFHIVVPSTPAQYFHVLRRQMARDFRRPLLVVTPKAMLRMPEATSRLSDMAPGTHFHHVLSTHNVNVKQAAVETVILCCGKHYYTLQQHLSTLNADQKSKVAIVRLEQLSPFPIVELSQLLSSSFSNAKRFVWSQEEHRNMGAWNFVDVRLRNWLGINARYAGRRNALAAPAVGIGAIHKKEAEDILFDTFSA